MSRRPLAGVIRRRQDLHGVADSDSKRILRQWNREIDAELRRAAAPREDGPWRAVAWGALWLCWLLLVLAMVAVVRPLH